MEVEYQLTGDDLFAFQWRAAYLSPKSRRARRISYLYLLLPFLVIALLPVIGPGRSMAAAKFNLLMIVTVYPIAALLAGVFHRRMLRRAIRALVAEEKPEKGQLGSHKMAIDDVGLVETTPVGQSRTAWSGVDRVEQDTGYIYIYTAPTRAHVIPKRAFAQSDADGFYQFALRHYQEAIAM